jgi:branched-chain amino acid transport system ATP-binding protein
MLTVSDIHTYYDTSYVLMGVSLLVSEAETVALLGRNGAGKTTTLKSIMGIVPPRRGSVTYKGHELIGLKPYRIARLGIGYVPEDRRIYADFTVKENLEVVFRNIRGDAKWSVDKVFDLFPELTRIQRRMGYQLSGGEAQMLTIGRTLLTNPHILLLDEPSEGLAPIVVSRLMEAIRKLKNNGESILISEQNSRFAINVADRVCLLNQGQVVFEGSCTAFLEDSELARRHLLF